MYLDNLVSAATRYDGPQITYSEIIEDALRMSEAEAQGEMLLMKAEAANHILGSEGPKEWWDKIKIVARKLWEMLKNLVNKVFTFIKNVPQKVANVFRRIQLKWNKMGLEEKIKKMNKKEGQELRPEDFDDLRDRSWNIPYDLEACSQVRHQSQINKSNAHVLATEINRKLTGITALLNASARSDEADAAEHRGNISALTAEIRNDIADTFDRANDVDIKVFRTANNVATFKSIVNSIYSSLKSNVPEKTAERETKDYDKLVRNLAAAAKSGFGTLEKHQRNGDDEAARSVIDGMKADRMMVSICASCTSKMVNAVLRSGIAYASIVSAVTAKFKGGSSTTRNNIT